MNFKVNWLAFEPNLELVKKSYTRCATLADDYELPLPPNSTFAGNPLAGRHFGIFTIPLPGYNGYYHLADPSHPDRNLLTADGREQAIWCGEVYTLIHQIGRQSGMRVKFHTAPSSMARAVELVALQKIQAIVMVSYASMMSMFPFSGFIRRGNFVFDAEDGNIISRLIYLRHETAFMDCFTAESWQAILITLGLLSLITSIKGWRVGKILASVTSKVEPLVGPELRSMSQVAAAVRNEELWLRKIRDPRNSRRKKFLGSRLKNLVLDWSRVALDFLGIMFGESSPSLHYYYRGFTGLWYVATIVFLGCLAGSLRELLSEANQKYSPENYGQIFYDPLYAQHILIAFRFLPCWNLISPRYDTELAARRENGLLDTIDINTLLDAFIFNIGGIQNIGSTAGVWKMAFHYINAIMDIEHHIIVIYKLIFFIVAWGAQVCRTALVKLYASLLAEENPMEISIEKERDAFYIEKSEEKIDKLFAEFKQHAAISGGFGSVQWYFPFTLTAPQDQVAYVNKFINRFRDAGFIKILTEKTDESMEERFFPKASSEQSAGDWEVLTLGDFSGPLLATATVTGLACVMFSIETLAGRSRWLAKIYSRLRKVKTFGNFDRAKKLCCWKKSEKKNSN